MPDGPAIFADVAKPPSPVSPANPVPATVVIIPPVVILRTRRLITSVRKRFPLLSQTSPLTLLISADVAGPLSPLKPKAPVPQTVAMSPAAIVTPRTV